VHPAMRVSRREEAAPASPGAWRRRWFHAKRASPLECLRRPLGTISRSQGLRDGAPPLRDKEQRLAHALFARPYPLAGFAEQEELAEVRSEAG
jgi:hypothetical protein